MAVFNKTRTAGTYIRRRGPAQLARTRASILLTGLDACETALADGAGEVSPFAEDLLCGLVKLAGELVGQSWLAANADDRDVTAFTAVATVAGPPRPAVLDEILSRVLWARFAPDRLC